MLHPYYKELVNAWKNCCFLWESYKTISTLCYQNTKHFKGKTAGQHLAGCIEEGQEAFSPDSLGWVSVFIQST